MREELEQKLFNDFPFMQARNVWTGEKLDFLMPCDFGDGWYDLIYACMKEIKGLYKEKGANIKELRILQLKEKFGSMRIYVGNYIKGVDEITSKYEKLSEQACEVCGVKGEVRISGTWLKCLCEKHRDEYGYRDCKKYYEEIDNV